jgi:hypothetical protein
MLRRLLTIFGYLLAALAIVGFTVGLVAYGNDYTYDFASGKIIQKGHVIVESVPSGIRLMADGKLLNKKTPYQAAYSVGDHTFRLEKDGFTSWEKVLKVVAGRVSLANYVILVPKKPVVADFDSRPQITAQSISKDHRHLAYVAGGNDPGVFILDMGNKKVVKLYSPKDATPTSGAEVIKDIAWSDDASHLLIVSDVGGVLTHRLATASNSPAEPVNLTQSFGFSLAGLHFSGGNWRQLYFISPDGLRRLDVDASTVSAVLADKVSQFWVQPDRVLYVQQTDLGRSLWSTDNRGKKQELISALVESDSYSVALSNYENEDELAVVPAKTGVATLYSAVFGDNPVAKVIAQNVTAVNFSPDGHLLALTSATGVTVYDLERSKLEQSFVVYPQANRPGALLAMSWFDNHHILANRDGELYWSEFDGNNSIDLGKGYGSLPANSDADTKNVIAYQPTESGVKIVELQIRK